MAEPVYPTLIEEGEKEPIGFEGLTSETETERERVDDKRLKKDNEEIRLLTTEERAHVS